MPASSMITSVDGPTAAAQSGRSPCWSDQVSLASVSVRMPVCSARTAAAAADGARPSTWPPSWVQARVRARMAVVFPAPAGAIASCSRAPEVHIWRTSAACPASSAVPFAAISSKASSTAVCSTDCTAATSRRGDETGLGVEDPLRGVEVGAGDGVDRGAVEPPQHLRFLDAVVRRGQGNRSAIEHLIDEQVHQCRGTFSGQVDGADLPLRFGADVPHLPGRAAVLHDGQDVIGRLCDPAGVGDRGGPRSAGERRPHHRSDGATSAQHCCRFVQPGGALLGQGSGFVFGVAGLQRRLLRQLQRFDRCRRPAMIMLELDGELAAAGVDVGTAGGPAFVQSWVDTDDLPDRPLRRVGAGPFGEPHPQGFTQVLFEGGVVGLRGCNVGFEQHPSVDRQPPSIEGLDLVGHRDVGVQIRVAGPAVAVGERGRDEASDVDLPDPLWPGPGEQRVLLDERQSVLHGGLMGLFDDGRHRRFGDRPQGRDRLHRRERQVIPRDRLGTWPRVFRDLSGQLPGIEGSRPCSARKNSRAT